MKEKYALILKDGKLYANAYITFSSNANIKNITKHGVIIGTNKGSISTALLPINNLELISKIEDIKYIQIGETVQPTMDAARSATNVHQVHAGNAPLTQSYYGEGVVVGIIDIGFDYAHPNFYDHTGTSGYRIKRVWEQDAPNGTPPSGYNYGRELTTQASIIAAQTDMYDQSHGSHVAGIAAGAGGGLTNTYAGVASKADIVLVSPSNNSSSFIDAIAYIQDYATSVGKPCVINISWGSHVGPHDGTSTFDMLCDSFYVGEGRILVGAAGNDGSKNVFAGKTYTLVDTQLYTFLSFPGSYNGNTGGTYVDIWGEVGDSFQVAVYIHNNNTNTFEDVTALYNSNVTGNYNDTLYDWDTWGTPDPCYIQIATGLDPNNNKPRATLIVSNYWQDDAFRHVIIGIRGKNTTTKMWASHAVFTNYGYSAPAISGSSNSSIGELGGTGKSMISVGAYTSKNTWNSYGSGTQNAGYFTAIGEIAPFSSKGPTADNRIKPDITAPGNVIVASVNSYDNNYPSNNSRVVSGVTVGSKTWWFGTMQGTSMAAPMTTGIIALWLEMYPDLTFEQAKDIMNSNAITDGFTGTIPAGGSNLWGNGKINAFVNILAELPTQPSITPTADTICEGTIITLNAPSGFTSYKWNTGDTTASIDVNTAGIYKVKVKNNNGFYSPWSDEMIITINPVPVVPTIIKVVDTLISSAATGNQWYKDGNIINGATNQRYTITDGGSYKVVVTNNFNCSSESEAMMTAPVSISNIEFSSDISIYPNPTAQLVNIKFDSYFKELSYAIYDHAGKLLQTNNWEVIEKGSTKTIQLGTLPNGTYSIKFSNKETEFSKKITIVK